jgi:hypothetical protein
MKALGFAAALAGAALAFAAPAQAVVFDAFTSFTGATPQTANTNGHFIYGQANRATPGTAGVNYTLNSSCFIAGSVCLQGTPGTVPGVTKSTTTSFQYGTVNVPDDRLLAHPGFGSADDLTYLAFVAPVAGSYTFNATFNIQDTNPSGVGINLIRTTSGGLPLIYSTLGTINGTSGPGSILNYTNVFTLGAFEAVGFGLSNLGNVNDDSTGVQFSVATSAVPEPATWAMMIGGFGLIGGSMRMRRRTAMQAIA